jgi:hypothetical protein
VSGTRTRALDRVLSCVNFKIVHESAANPKSKNCPIGKLDFFTGFSEKKGMICVPIFQKRAKPSLSIFSATPSLFLRALLISLFLIGHAFANELSESVSPTLLEASLNQHIADVEEFRFIREEAKRLGVQVYLTGEAASQFATYVRWDTLREKGDTHYIASRFNYDYNNIYPTDQALNLVIDGSQTKAKALQSAIAKHFPHSEEINSPWQVRTIAQDSRASSERLSLTDAVNEPAAKSS